MPAAPSTRTLGTHTTLVIHPGALGDTILLWPLLRALKTRGPVAFAARQSFARLAQAEVGVDGVDIDRFRLADARLAAFQAPLGCVLHAVAGDGSRAQDATPEPWVEHLVQANPGCRLRALGPPGSASRADLAREVDAAGAGRVVPRTNPHGPVVVHVGAGSPAKRWPLEHALALMPTLSSHAPTRLIAGEVERERFSRDEHARFADAGGVFIDELAELANTLRAARLLIGNDSGPTHLAAQLGVRTLALFGPTDPSLWAPVGPLVRVLAPPLPRPMTWLDPAQVALATTDALADSPSSPS